MSTWTPKQYPELLHLARHIAYEVVAPHINEHAPKRKADTPYKEQYTLEELIKILQDMV
ncbi:hypothetical protein LCGC14_1715340 [marine sediment metagenome]|uniref:Uncharacterized protein n=1 Tax=marine sediment metagenome TaxID=412755 RepID=A0A0F9JUJ5_9ZZZZ